MKTRIFCILLALVMPSCKAASEIGTMAAVGFIMAPYLIVDRITETKEERAERLRWKADRKASREAWERLEKGQAQ